MEGTLLVPPDRGTIIGRAVWKSRYVVIGPPSTKELQSPSIQSPIAQAIALSKLNASRISSPRTQTAFGSDPICISIFKHKDDNDPVQQYGISSVTDCSVQMVAHRKQGPHLPTLVLNMSPDPATDKLRKRRSSRTAGLASMKDNPNSLWFRMAPDDNHTLHDWARHIQPLLSTPTPTPSSSLASPISPNSPSFGNPFSGIRPQSGSTSTRGPPQNKPQGQQPSSRDRPTTISSESPSLKSKQSDISSHASSANQTGFTAGSGNGSGSGHNYTTAAHAGADRLPSPVATTGEYAGEAAEGWTAAHGRSMAVSSSVEAPQNQAYKPAPPPMINPASPPAPRETILDRAFQLRVIPGSQQTIPGEEKLSSLARFDALMREAEEKCSKREPEHEDKPETDSMKSAWDLDDSSEEEDSVDYNVEYLEDTGMSPRAQQALDFIDNRHNAAPPPRPSNNRTSYHPDTIRALTGEIGPMRPHTGYDRRPHISQRTNSTPKVPADVPHSAASTVRTGDDMSSQQRNGEKRRSSAKQLGLNDFTKRLSSSSSLLLVQNHSGGSSRDLSEVETQTSPVPRSARAPPPPPGQRPNEQDWDNMKRCGWRGSVGGFL